MSTANKTFNIKITKNVTKTVNAPVSSFKKGQTLSAQPEASKPQAVQNNAFEMMKKTYSPIINSYLPTTYIRLFWDLMEKDIQDGKGPAEIFLGHCTLKNSNKYYLSIHRKNGEIFSIWGRVASSVQAKTYLSGEKRYSTLISQKKSKSGYVPIIEAKI